MATFISHSPAETEELGAQWGREASTGWLIGFNGNLGAGKTQLIKGIARGLNISEIIQSPTFGLVQSYDGGRLPLVHIDLYRLSNTEQIIRAGLEEHLTAPGGVTVVEWIERWLPASEAPQVRGRFRRVNIVVIDETTREITYEDPGR